MIYLICRFGRFDTVSVGECTISNYVRIEPPKLTQRQLSTQPLSVAEGNVDNKEL